jgi:hypothetical protein
VSKACDVDNKNTFGFILYVRIVPLIFFGIHETIRLLDKRKVGHNMTTLYKNKALCVGDKFHTPNKQAISVVAYSFADGEAYTFCEVCEQNISQFSFYDEDRGIVYTKWEIE